MNVAEFWNRQSLFGELQQLQFKRRLTALQDVMEEKVEEITPEQNAIIENKLWEDEIRGLIARIQGAERKDSFRTLAVYALVDSINKLQADSQMILNSKDAEKKTYERA